jgi:transcriptional regulator with XRE-family HTH domain
MQIGQKIRKIREAQRLSQKQVALSINMDQSQYSKIEKGKTDPTCSTLERIATALNIDLANLFTSEEVADINSFDKSLVDKLKLMQLLDQEEQLAIHKIIDSLIAKKKLKDTLSNALDIA